LHPLQDAIKELRERSSAATQAHEAKATQNSPNNARVNGGGPTRSLEIERLDALSYALNDLERRFNYIQTEELASKMLHQMRTLYPAPATILKSFDGQNRKMEALDRRFEAIKSQVDQMSEDEETKTANDMSDAAHARADLATVRRNVGELSDQFHKEREIWSEGLSRVQALEVNLEQIKKQFSGLRDGFMALKKDVSDLGGGFTTLKATLKEEVQGVKKSTEEMRTRVGDHEEEIVKIENVLDVYFEKMGVAAVQWSD